MTFAEDSLTVRHRPWRGGEALQHARTCYDHIAGRIAVAITDRLLERSFVVLDEDGSRLTRAGESFFDAAAIDLRAWTRRTFCRPCLDWSERRPHLAGVVGAAMLRHALANHWVKRMRDSRALTVTPTGITALGTLFDLDVARLQTSGS